MPPDFVAGADALAERIPDAVSLATSTGEGPDVPMALARAIVRRGVRGLHLVTVPTAAFPAVGMMADLLIGAGCVRSVETSGISLGELGPAPRFSQAVRARTLMVRDTTCPALIAAVQAGAKGQPFTTLRGLIGSDLLAHRSDYMVIANPFADGDPVVAFKAINPAVAILHAPCADRDGNVWFGRARTSLDIAHAADRVLVTVDAIVDRCLLDDERDAAGTIPGFYVDAIACVPGGSLPMRLDGSTDIATVTAYARAAQSDEGFRAWVDAHVHGRQPAEAAHGLA